MNDDTSNIKIDPSLYHDLEDEFISSKGKAGGGKTKRFKYHGKKTANAIVLENIENSMEHRMEKSLEKIKKDLETFDFNDEEKVERYYKWLRSAYYKEGDLYDEEDLEEKFTRSTGAGGQGVNKVNTAVVMKHLPTNIQIENQETREQVQNRDNARDILNIRLKEHVGYWKSLTGDNYHESRVRTILSELKTA